MHDDRPVAEDGREPTRPAPPDPAPRAPDLANEDVLCVQCSYNLRGLDEDARCPECGTVVSRSLQGNLLKFSSDDYLRSLELGVTIIITTIALRVLAIILGIGLAITAGIAASTGSLPDWINTIGIAGAEILGFGVEIASLWGWWLFTAPDPAVLGSNTGSRARRIIRITVIASGVFAVIEGVTTIAGTSGGPIGAAAASGGEAASGLAMLAFIAKFFAAMVYVRWLAPRLPNKRVETRARTLMWLGPVLCLGFCLLFIPFLVALVLYWNMLNWVRADIVKIRSSR